MNKKPFDPQKLPQTPPYEVLTREDGARFREATVEEEALAISGVKGLDLWLHEGRLYKRLRSDENA